MVRYKCFNCNEEVAMDYVRKRIRCPYCGSKIIYKARERVTHVKAR